MNKTATCFLAASLFVLPGAVWSQQTKSPDQQQERNAGNQPPHKANEPQTDTTSTGPAQTGQNPDLQQQTNTGAKHKKKSKTNARQAHGTPQPKNDTATTH